MNQQQFTPQFFATPTKKLASGVQNPSTSNETTKNKVQQFVPTLQSQDLTSNPKEVSHSVEVSFPMGHISSSQQIRTNKVFSSAENSTQLKKVSKVSDDVISFENEGPKSQKFSIGRTMARSAQKENKTASEINENSKLDFSERKEPKLAKFSKFDEIHSNLLKKQLEDFPGDKINIKAELDLKKNRIKKTKDELIIAKLLLKQEKLMRVMKRKGVQGLMIVPASQLDTLRAANPKFKVRDIPRYNAEILKKEKKKRRRMQKIELKAKLFDRGLKFYEQNLFKRPKKSVRASKSGLEESSALYDKAEISDRAKIGGTANIDYGNLCDQSSSSKVRDPLAMKAGLSVNFVKGFKNLGSFEKNYSEVKFDTFKGKLLTKRAPQ